ncbi:nucleolar protein 14-like [Ostrinia furnacalis]|uniref:nucleolar protein 14-like n=1 Tax=Ostrinia furnacalis TaxID=93504 RepID=UPI00103E4E4F|nr:nucleolar protein 14-like [Ostrinia furnacalis]
MAKAKNKRNSGLADKVNNKRKGDGIKKKLNPFEVHINREKIKVLGKKSKHDRGLPGVSRAKAIQKRKETLGTEMKLMNKTNTFIDKRIGEKNNQLSSEDRMIARFAAERARQHSKKDIYNLADDEILTHRGQTLEQIEKFDDPRSDDEDDDAKKFGGLDDDFVSEGHFGGGILTRTEAKDGAKSHKDLIEQLIAESKKRKAEKQKEKEQTLDLTEKLDSEWKDLQPVVFKRPRVEEKESAIEKLLSQAEKKSEDYDKMMRELRFEKRGTPSDGLKNDEKQAKEEQARLEKLERERLQRMEEDDDMFRPRVQKTVPKHRYDDISFQVSPHGDFL